MKTPEGRQAQSGVVGEQLTLIDPPPFSPIWPKRGSLPERALHMLLDGKRIDHADFIKHACGWRLAAAIHDLRELGWPVQTIEVPRPTKHAPRRVIGLYVLELKYVAMALLIAKGANDEQ
jgi:hypothetical protein